LPVREMNGEAKYYLIKIATKEHDNEAGKVKEFAPG
jgi:hypothetical protein